MNPPIAPTEALQFLKSHALSWEDKQQLIQAWQKLSEQDKGAIARALSQIAHQQIVAR